MGFILLILLMLQLALVSADPPFSMTGATGATGAIGSTGAIGATGTTGAIGPIGPTTSSTLIPFTFSQGGHTIAGSSYTLKIGSGGGPSVFTATTGMVLKAIHLYLNPNPTSNPTGSLKAQIWDATTGTMIAQTQDFAFNNTVIFTQVPWGGAVAFVSTTSFAQDGFNVALIQGHQYMMRTIASADYVGSVYVSGAVIV